LRRVTADTTAPSGADDWDLHWDCYADAARRNPAQRFRRRLALELLEARGAPARLLDIGSGQGDLLAAAGERWPRAELTGIEPSEVGVRVSSEKVPQARFLTLDPTAEPPPPELAGWATHAVCSEVLEHVDDDAGLLGAARPLMAAGCRLVVTVPGGRMSAFDKRIGHRRHYDQASLARVLEDAGFEVEATAAAGFPFLNLYRRLVIARGERLADDVTATRSTLSPRALLARAAMLAFLPLLRVSRTHGARGPQMVGVAIAPDR
jgi:trans-aconitate methyltransferase